MRSRRNHLQWRIQLNGWRLWNLVAFVLWHWKHRSCGSDSFTSDYFSWWWIFSTPATNPRPIPTPQAIIQLLFHNEHTLKIHYCSTFKDKSKTAVRRYLQLHRIEDYRLLPRLIAAELYGDYHTHFCHYYNGKCYCHYHIFCDCSCEHTLHNLGKDAEEHPLKEDHFAVCAANERSRLEINWLIESLFLEEIHFMACYQVVRVESSCIRRSRRRHREWFDRCLLANDQAEWRNRRSLLPERNILVPPIICDRERSLLIPVGTA